MITAAKAFVYAHPIAACVCGGIAFLIVVIVVTAKCLGAKLW